MGTRSLRSWDRSILTAIVISLLFGAAAAQAANRGAPTRLEPVLGRIVLAARVSGIVRVKAAGERSFAPLTQIRPIAVGATIDTTRGTVKLVTAAAARGKRQTGQFSGGAFMVFQDRSGTTNLRLVGGRRSEIACRSRASATGAAVGAASSVSSGVLRLLRGQAHGHFTTVGSYSSATVRGTEWQTIDRCDGTQTVDTKGVVDTTTGSLKFSLKPGQTAIGYCFPANAPPLKRLLCVLELSQPAQGLFAFGIGVRRPATSYQLCVRAPSGTERCRQFRLSAPNATGVRASAVACPQADGAGSYFVRWLVSGQQVGVTLPFTATLPAAPMGLGGCSSQP